jgi:hypothetical protein
LSTFVSNHDFVMSSGFLTGYEMDWLPAVVGILRAELPSTEVVIHSQDSPDLAAASALLAAEISIVEGG